MYFDVPNHYIFKKIWECHTSFFSLSFLIRNTNLKHDLTILFEIFS